jgi:hypothetical protein
VPVGALEHLHGRRSVLRRIYSGRGSQTPLARPRNPKRFGPEAALTWQGQNRLFGNPRACLMRNRPVKSFRESPSISMQTSTARLRGGFLAFKWADSCRAPGSTPRSRTTSKTHPGDVPLRSLNISDERPGPTELGHRRSWMISAGARKPCGCRGHRRSPAAKRSARRHRFTLATTTAELHAGPAMREIPVRVEVSRGAGLPPTQYCSLG